MLRTIDIPDDRWQEAPGMISQAMHDIGGCDQRLPINVLPYVGKQAVMIVALNLLLSKEEFAEFNLTIAKMMEAVKTKEAASIAALQPFESGKPAQGICPICDQPFLAIGWNSEVCPSCVNGDARAELA
jgi:hypothetical protein